MWIVSVLHYSVLSIGLLAILFFAVFLLRQLAPLRPVIPAANKLVIVTGAASGLGKAVCEELSSRGVRVWAVDVNSAVKNIGVAEKYSIVDVSSSESVANWERNELANGRVQVFALVNCAGIAQIRSGKHYGQILPSVEYDMKEELEPIMEVNMMGTFRITQAVAAFLERGGAIVNLGSIAGIIGGCSMGAYVASKHAVAGFTKCLDLELRPTLGIRSFNIQPGFVNTPMLAPLKEGHVANPVLEKRRLPSLENDPTLESARVFLTDSCSPEKTMEPAQVAKEIADCIFTPAEFVHRYHRIIDNRVNFWIYSFMNFLPWEWSHKTLIALGNLIAWSKTRK